METCKVLKKLNTTDILLKHDKHTCKIPTITPNKPIALPKISTTRI